MSEILLYKFIYFIHLLSQQVSLSIHNKYYSRSQKQQQPQRVTSINQQEMNNSTTQSVPNQHIINDTNLSQTYHPNTTTALTNNRKLSFINNNNNRNNHITSNKRYQRKTSSLQICSTNKSYISIIQHANNQLQQYLFNLNQHIKTLIQKRQADYLSAFTNHVGFVQKQLKNIKQTYQQSKLYQKAISLEQVIIRLQKQCEIFRNQAVRYFQLLEEKQQQLKITKRDKQSVSKQLEISEFTKKKMISIIKKNNNNNHQNKQLVLGNQQYQQGGIDVQNIIDQLALGQYVELQKIKSQRTVVISNDKNNLNIIYNNNNNNNNNNNGKFRKTLMQFNPKQSSEHFKFNNFSSSSSSARIHANKSFMITTCNNKYCNQQNNDIVDNNDNDKTTKSFKKTSHRHHRFHSQHKLNHFLNIQEDKNDQQQNNNNKYKQLKNNLKTIIKQRIKLKQQQITLIHTNNQPQKLSPFNSFFQDFNFNFNSDQSITQFLNFLFPEYKQLQNYIDNNNFNNQSQKHKQHKQLQQQKQKDYLLKKQNKQKFPFQLISTPNNNNKNNNNKRLKTQSQYNPICSTIYSVQKGQRFNNTISNNNNNNHSYNHNNHNSNSKDKYSLLTSNKHKIITISKKKSTLKNKLFNAQWADLKINKKKITQQQQKLDFTIGEQIF